MSKLWKLLFLGLIVVATTTAFASSINAVPETLGDWHMMVYSIKEKPDGLYVIYFEGKRTADEYPFYYPYLTYDTVIANELEIDRVKHIPVYLNYRQLMWDDPENSSGEMFKGYKILKIEPDR